MTLALHVAVLDPGTGMGILVLPPPAHSTELLLLSFSGDEADGMASWWFAENLHAYTSTIRTLSSIGWELPEDNVGRRAWFEAGRMDCCGRMIISLVGQDAEGVDVPIEDLLRAADHMQQAAADACLCRHHTSLP